MFESSVNSEGIETESKVENGDWMFESSVNSEGIETDKYMNNVYSCLRAV